MMEKGVRQRADGNIHSSADHRAEVFYQDIQAASVSWRCVRVGLGEQQQQR